MCTLIVLNETVEGHPLVVAANRDERYDRLSRSPEVHGDIIRPWDDERDGTWMGVTREGWFVGITNQDNGTHDETALSRGHVVRDCLYAGTHSGACKVLASLDAKRYNPFNLVFGRAGSMFLCRVMDGLSRELVELHQGISVISNDCWGEAYLSKVLTARKLARCMTDPPPRGGIERIRIHLKVALLSHIGAAEGDPYQALCVHADADSFGTRSSSLVTVSKEGAVEYWYSDGHPCQSDGLRLMGRLER